MEELQLVNIENTSIRGWDFETLKTQLQTQLDKYKNIVYTDDNIKSAKESRTTLNKVKKIIEDARKNYKAECLAPYDALEPKIKELVSMVEEQRLLIDETVKDFESRKKQQKEIEVRKYYDKKSFVLGELAESLYEKIMDTKWLNASTTKGKYEEEIQTAINKALNDISSIREMETPFVETLLEVYVETVSMEAVIAKNKELVESMNKAGISQNADVAEEKLVRKIEVSHNADEAVMLKVFATQGQLEQICDFMKAIGVTYEIQ